MNCPPDVLAEDPLRKQIAIQIAFTCCAPVCGAGVCSLVSLRPLLPASSLRPGHWFQSTHLFLFLRSSCLVLRSGCHPCGSSHQVVPTLCVPSCAILSSLIPLALLVPSSLPESPKHHFFLFRFFLVIQLNKQFSYISGKTRDPSLSHLESVLRILSVEPYLVVLSSSTRFNF